MFSDTVDFSRLHCRLSSRYGEGEARAIVRLVLDDAFGVRPVDVYADKVRHFSEDERSRLDRMLRRLEGGEPVQYVLGHACFAGRRYEVTPDVLIPRPETEELAAWVEADGIQPGGRLLDAGTGSGCLAVTLALDLPGTTVEAWDVSPGALDVARRNARRLGANVVFTLCDLLAQPPTAGPFDVIVSNPPYVCRAEAAGMEAHVLDHEPALALFVPDDDPLLFYRALARLGRRRLQPGGRVYVELNQAFGPATADLFRATGYEQVELRRDQFGRDRMLKAVSPAPTALSSPAP